jgi:hypothetical protein
VIMVTSFPGTFTRLLVIRSVTLTSSAASARSVGLRNSITPIAHL